MKVIEGKKRKTRTDKKKDIKPSIDTKLKEAIYRLSYITDQPVKDVAQELCEAGIISKKVIEHISQYFRRDVRLMNTMYLGDLERESLQKRSTKIKERISIRFPQHTAEDISSLAYALDVTPTRATAILLEASMKNSEFVNEYVQQHVGSYLHEGKLKELKKILKFVNENNPYKDEEISWGELMSVLFDEIKTGTTTFKNALTNWIDDNKIE